MINMCASLGGVAILPLLADYVDCFSWWIGQMSSPRRLDALLSQIGPIDASRLLCTVGPIGAHHGDPS